MSDYVPVTTSDSGSKVAADEVAVNGSTLYFQRIKLALGADNAVDMDVDSGQQTAANSIPVVIASNQTQVIVGGSAAHSDAAVGNPILLGARAEGVEPTAVSASDMARLYTDLVGKLIVLPYGEPTAFVSGTGSMGTTTDTIIMSSSTGKKIFVTQILMTNKAADGSVAYVKGGGAVIYQGYCSACGGFAVTLPAPLVVPSGCNLILNQLANTGSLYMSATGYNGV